MLQPLLIFIRLFFMAKQIDISGVVYGRLTVLRLDHVTKRGRTAWLCICECGNTAIVKKDALRDGSTKSCGCFKKERLGEQSKKHGHYSNLTPSPTYNSWAAMKERCLNEKSNSYSRYGAVGITVCNRWLKFENFLEDMGERPSSKHSLDRFPNQKGNYEPTNCRWATFGQQSRNLTTNRWIEHNGKKMILQDWASFLGCDQSTLHVLLKKRTIGEVVSYYEEKYCKCYIF